MKEERERERERERDTTDRQTDRQTEREKYRKKVSKKERERERLAVACDCSGPRSQGTTSADSGLVRRLMDRECHRPLCLINTCLCFVQSSAGGSSYKFCIDLNIKAFSKAVHFRKWIKLGSGKVSKTIQFAR